MAGWRRPLRLRDGLRRAFNPPHRDPYTTIELKVNYIRALTKETGRIRCEGRRDRGRRTDRHTAEAR
jgi:acyl-coenzyme A thioesterase PaaI-like protein